MENATNGSFMDCPDFTEGDSDMLRHVSFWVEGTLSCSIAIAGFLGNVGSSIILSAKEMRNSFNWLLIALACFDNIYLMGSILESFRKDFGLETHIHVILFPYLLYPIQTIAMTGSILMTVAIAFERYVAVHYPLNYSQAVNDVYALKHRIIKFLLPVCGLSLMFNVTKFFEATYTYSNATEPMTNADKNLTVLSSFAPIPILEPTALRMNPLYSIYFNWFRFVAIGVIPFALLVLFYAKIYSDIQNRRRNSQYRRKQAAAKLASYTSHQSKANNGIIESNHFELQVLVTEPRLVVAQSTRKDVKVCEEDDEVSQEKQIAKDAQEPAAKNPECNDEERGSNNNPAKLTLIKSCHDIAYIDANNHRHQEHAKVAEEASGIVVKSVVTVATVPTGKTVGFATTLRKNCMDDEYEDYESSTDHLLREAVDQGEFGSTTNALSLKRRNRSLHRKTKANANAKRRRMEDQLASIFMGYILVFLVCHSPRLMLNIYELATIREAVACSSAGNQPFPAWSLVVMCFSHLFLVVNSSINILIYCVLSTKFREEACRMWTNITRKL